jgi:hypothetical protein
VSVSSNAVLRNGEDAMNTTDTLKDPFYVPILLHIERRILKADEAAQANGISFTDSAVRSILNKVRKQAKGGNPKLPAGSQRDAILVELYQSIVELRALLAVTTNGQKTDDLPLTDWLHSLRTVEDSIKLRSTTSGGRNYLNFLSSFIHQMDNG